MLGFAQLRHPYDGDVTHFLGAKCTAYHWVTNNEQVHTTQPGHGWSFLLFYPTGEKMGRDSPLRRSAITQRCHCTVSCWTTTTAPTVRWRRRTQHTDQPTFVPAKERSATTRLSSLPVSFSKQSKLSTLQIAVEPLDFLFFWQLWWVFYFTLRPFTATQPYFGPRWRPTNF